MRLLAVAVIALLATYAADAQRLAPRDPGLVTIHFVTTPFDDVIGVLSRQVGIDVQFDETATDEHRSTKLTLHMRDVTLEDALDTMTRLAGLSYKVVDPQTILILRLP